MKTTNLKSKPRNLQTTTRQSTRAALRVRSNWLCLMVFASFAMAAGCAVRDNAFRVRGKVETLQGTTGNCTMAVYRADSGTLVSKKNINVEFQTSVVIAPGVHDYYLTILCPGSSTVYKSPVFSFGTAGQYEHPLDLGTVSLKNAAH
jgi:hypothetical protein